MSPEVGGNHKMAGMEDQFDDSEWSFDQRTDCDLFPFFTHDPSRLLRVFAASPRGLSAGA